MRNLLAMFCLLMPGMAAAINISSLTTVMKQTDKFVSISVLNNNRTARIYQVVVNRIDHPGEMEQRSKISSGELLFSPGKMVLQAGLRDNYKFYYKGPQDNQERYYRIWFREIPSGRIWNPKGADSRVMMEPVLVLSTLLVVRPSDPQLRYTFDRTSGVLRNNGNTFFRILVKPRCNVSDDDSDSFYLLPGSVLRDSALKSAGNKFIIYDGRFIAVDKACPE